MLTRTLAREVLNERLKDFTPADADRILGLTICEPAMGSAAFINEMCEQLAHAYLRLKQEQTGLVIEPGRYGTSCAGPSTTSLLGMSTVSI